MGHLGLTQGQPGGRQRVAENQWRKVQERFSDDESPLRPFWVLFQNAPLQPHPYPCPHLAGFLLNFYSTYPALEMLSDSEQLQTFKADMLSGKMLISYAQT
jgi:hypothetical protein